MAYTIHIFVNDIFYRTIESRYLDFAIYAQQKETPDNYVASRAGKMKTICCRADRYIHPYTGDSKYIAFVGDATVEVVNGILFLRKTND